MSTTRALPTRRLPQVLRQTSFVCPTCALAQAKWPSQQRPPFSKRNANPSSIYNAPRRRHVSSLTSHTAINASKEIPPHLKTLHDSLNKLKKDAASFVNISRLQLAIRSVESSTPVIRLAILGLQPNQRTARRVARLLLADPLGDEEDWERKLEAFKGDDGRGLLLRYGDETDASPPRPSETAMYIPSRVLQRHNLEVLISSFSMARGTLSDSAGAAEFRRAALVPTAESPASFSGGFSFLTYPVHRALIVADGLQGCFTLGKYTSGDGGSLVYDDVAVKLASNLPALAGQTGDAADQSAEVSIIDAKKAANAINALRESISNSSTYEQLWNASGLPDLEKWLANGHVEESTDHIEPPIRVLVEDIVEEASRTIAAEEDIAQALASSSSATPDAVRLSFDEELKAWAMRAHIELRDSLDTAFTSTKWAKLAWWKLLWRTDDVSMMTNELLESSWLVDAGKSLIWLSGRSVQAGIPANPHTSTLKLPENLATSTTTRDTKTNATASTASEAEVEVEAKAFPLPWPAQIPAARHVLESTTIPPMQSLSQALLIQTMSFSALTSALSVLIYISFPSVSVYSAAAAGTLGIAWSLRRLQKVWERAREEWELEVRERGRVVLKDVEDQFRAVVLEKRQIPVDGTSEGDQMGPVDAGARDRLVARRAIEGVTDALGTAVGNDVSPRQ